MTSTTLASASSIPSKPTGPRSPEHSVAAPPHFDPIIASQLPSVKQIEVTVRDGHDGKAHGFLHLPSKPYSKTAAVLLSGAGGGVTGPSGMYLALASKVPTLSAHIPVLRLDYRYPAHTQPCVADTEAAMKQMEEEYGVARFVLIGWSFGGAPVLTLAGRDERVVGAATIASQTVDATDGAREAGRRGLPILLLHGTSDRTLSPRCSQNLHYQWMNGRKAADDSPAKLVMLDGDDHALSKNAKLAEDMIARFIVDCAGGEVDAEVLKADVLKSAAERRKIMEVGGDLRGPESIE